MRQTIATPHVRARLREWPGDPSIRHLILLDMKMVPSPDDVERWVADAFGDGSFGDGSVDAETEPPTAIRTGALFPAAAGVFESCGFDEIDRLALLERELRERPRRRWGTARRARPIATVRMSRREIDEAASIDQAAFPVGWSNDAASLRDIADATPQTRLRFAVRSDPPPAEHERLPIGFSITGRAGPTGYLQRLAVRPDDRRNGAARHLVEDAMDWLTRRGATRALVNTGVTNEAALTLYERLGFRRMDDELVVLERRRTR